MSDAFQSLKKRLIEMNDLEMSSAVLAWDHRVYMPERGAETRARQLSTLAKFSHQLFVAPERAISGFGGAERRAMKIPKPCCA